MRLLTRPSTDYSLHIRTAYECIPTFLHSDQTMVAAITCSSCKKLFEAKNIRNNLCEKCLAVEVVKHWLKSDEVK